MSSGGFVLGSMIDGRFSLSWRWQLFSSLLLCVVTILLLNAAFGLVYRNYSIENSVSDPETIFSTLILFSGVLFFIRRINSKFESKLEWSASLSYRIFVLLVVPIVISVLLIMFFQVIVNTIIFEVEYLRLLDQIVFTTVLSFGISLVLLSDFGIFLLNKWKQSATEAEKFKKENMEFRFDMLRNQVNPHFLFNSLNTLVSLIFEDQEQASDFVRQLAKVYRYVLENKDKDLVTLQEENEFLKSYLYLIQIRFAKGLQVELNFEMENKGMLPPMTVQLLVENAIKHNIVSSSKPLKLKIYVDVENYLVVSNNLQKKSQPEPSTRTGLDNIRNRYKYLSSRMIDVSESNELFTVRVPLIYQEEN